MSAARARPGIARADRRTRAIERRRVMTALLEGETLHPSKPVASPDRGPATRDPRLPIAAAAILRYSERETMTLFRRHLRLWVAAWLAFQVVSLSAFVPRDCCAAHRPPAQEQAADAACHHPQQAPEPAP